MKIIITYASAGAGHLKAAEAAFTYIKENYKDVDVKSVDVLSTTDTFFATSYNYGYAFLVRHMPFLWRLAFWVTDVKFLRWISRPIVSFADRLHTVKFSRFLIKENPDYIISAHFMTSQIAARLKRKHKITSKLITIVTDFGVHPFWISRYTDLYVVASDYTHQQLLLKGASTKDMVREWGIPISAKFTRPIDKQAVCNKLGLSQEKFTVLIATGSFGIGPIEEIADLLYNDVQILIVCARNNKLYEKLKAKNYPSSVVVFAFIDNIEELMSIADVIVTKPGGLSISESLTMGLMPIFIAPIPGQEMENIKALEHYGVGVEIEDPRLIKDKILALKNNPQQLNSIREKIDKIKKPFATRELCDAVCKGYLWASS